MRCCWTTILAVACAADPTSPAEPTGATVDTAAPAFSGDGPKLSDLQATLFTPSCARSTCHDAATAQAGLVLEEGQTWGSLVNRASWGAQGATLVVPGASTSSYLVLKLEGAPGIAGVQMPYGPALDPTQITPVRGWIDAGALDN